MAFELIGLERVVFNSVHGFLAFATRLAMCAGVSAIVLAGFAFVESAANAADDADAGSRKVSMAGLDLTRRADQEVLRHRLAVASRLACLDTNANGLDSDAWMSCYQDAMRNALAKAETMIAAAETGKRVASAGH